MLIARPPEARLDEAVGLACAIDLNVVARKVLPLRRPRPATYLGSGTVAKLAERISKDEIELVFARRLAAIMMRQQKS